MSRSFNLSQMDLTNSENQLVTPKYALHSDVKEMERRRRSYEPDDERVFKAQRTGELDENGRHRTRLGSLKHPTGVKEPTSHDGCSNTNILSCGPSVQTSVQAAKEEARHETSNPFMFQTCMASPDDNSLNDTEHWQINSAYCDRSRVPTFRYASNAFICRHCDVQIELNRPVFMGGDRCYCSNVCRKRGTDVEKGMGNRASLVDVCEHRKASNSLASMHDIVT